MFVPVLPDLLQLLHDLGTGRRSGDESIHRHLEEIRRDDNQFLQGGEELTVRFNSFLDVEVTASEQAAR
jgi:hypothetical protein